MNIRSTNEQLLGNYGLNKENSLVESNAIKSRNTKVNSKNTIVNLKVENTNGLKLGHEGKEVSELQTLLKNSGHFKSVVNGYYGKETESAVKTFQKSRGIKETGIIDLETKVAIAESRDVTKSVAYSTVGMPRMMRAKRSVDIAAGASIAGGVATSTVVSTKIISAFPKY